MLYITSGNAFHLGQVRARETTRRDASGAKNSLSRLKALQNASLQLQSRLQHETERIQNDFGGEWMLSLLGDCSDRSKYPAFSVVFRLYGLNGNFFLK